MARLRTLKPGFFKNEVLAEVAPLGRLLFQGLWTIADRQGRLEDRPRRIKAEVLPYDDADIDGLLGQLAQRGFILRYVVNGEPYIQVTNFIKHQNPHIKEPESTIPEPDEHSACTIPEPDEHSACTIPEPDEHHESRAVLRSPFSLTLTETPPTPPKGGAGEISQNSQGDDQHGSLGGHPEPDHERRQREADELAEQRRAARAKHRNQS